MPGYRVHPDQLVEFVEQLEEKGEHVVSVVKITPFYVFVHTTHRASSTLEYRPETDLPTYYRVVDLSGGDS